MKNYNYPLQRPQNIIEEMSNGKWFAALDLLSGYYHVKYKDNKSKEVMAFITQDGFYQFTRMNFGGASAPKQFQRIMEKIFRKEIDEGWLRVYIDDIMMKAENGEELRKRLKRVFEKCREKGLTLKQSKCKFMAK
jgi:hypothetical protein